MTERLSKYLIHQLAWAFFVCSLLFSATVAAIIFNDFRLDPPFTMVQAKASSPVEPGMTATIDIVYSRDVSQRMHIVDKWLTCDDGTQWNIAIGQQTGPLPPGEDAPGKIRFRVPGNIKPGQTCYYGSKVVYDRTILPDLYIRLPPIDVSVEIISKKTS